MGTPLKIVSTLSIYANEGARKSSCRMTVCCITSDEQHRTKQADRRGGCRCFPDVRFHGRACAEQGRGRQQHKADGNVDKQGCNGIFHHVRQHRLLTSCVLAVLFLWRGNCFSLQALWNTRIRSGSSPGLILFAHDSRFFLVSLASIA